jgi:hypothetical protein
VVYDEQRDKNQLCQSHGVPLGEKVYEAAKEPVPPCVYIRLSDDNNMNYLLLIKKDCPEQAVEKAFNTIYHKLLDNYDVTIAATEHT